MMTENLQWFGLVLTIIMGFGWGSFATMATYRIPRGMPWIGDKPRCFMCKHELNIIDYFSVFSYFIWRGKCRYCKKSYECSFSYFVTEFTITFFFVLCYLKYGFSDKFVLQTLLIVCAVILGVVDAENKKIPAKIIISLLCIGLVYRTFVDQTFYGALYCGILGGVLGLGIRHLFFFAKGQSQIGYDYTKWQHTDRFVGPGFDYVKMLAVVGVFLPIHHLLVFVVCCGIFVLFWYFVNKRSLRIGSIMAVLIVLAVIYPEIIDNIWRLFCNINFIK